MPICRVSQILAKPNQLPTYKGSYRSGAPPKGGRGLNGIDGPPGPITLWRGYRKLADMALGAQLAESKTYR